MIGSGELAVLRIGATSVVVPITSQEYTQAASRPMKILRASPEIAATWSSAGNFSIFSGSLAPVRSAPARCSGRSPSTSARSRPRRFAPRSSSGRQVRRSIPSTGAGAPKPAGASSSPFCRGGFDFLVHMQPHALGRQNLSADPQPKGMSESGSYPLIPAPSAGAAPRSERERRGARTQPLDQLQSALGPRYSHLSTSWSRA